MEIQASHESVAMWHNGEKLELKGGIDAALEQFRRLGVDAPSNVDFEKHRGETAAEKWAAEAVLDELTCGRPEPVAALIDALGYQRPETGLAIHVRGFAARALRRLGPAASGAIPALAICAKQDADYGLQLDAACALAAIGPTALPALVALLGDPEVRERWPVVYALGTRGIAAKPAVSALTRLLADANERLRREVAETLRKIGAET